VYFISFGESSRIVKKFVQRQNYGTTGLQYWFISQPFMIHRPVTLQWSFVDRSCVYTTEYNRGNNPQMQLGLSHLNNKGYFRFWNLSFV
jgi:hypothetical protein